MLLTLTVWLPAVLLCAAAVGMQAREKGVDTQSSRQQRQQQREGLGRVGPLRFRNSKKALAEEVSPAAAADDGKEQPADKQQ
jgi:hypothetical protein